MRDLINLIRRRLVQLTLAVPFILLSIQQKFKTLPQGRKSIVFTLDDDRLYRDEDGSGRYAYMILNRFSEGGYNVYFYKKVNFLGFFRLGRYGRFIYSIKNLKFITRLPAHSEDICYAFDHVRKDILKFNWKKLTYVNVLKPTFCQAGEMINIPYFFHPVMYKLDQIGSVEGLRKNQRKLRIFFGGNTAKLYYDYHTVKGYNQLSRLEAINALLAVGGKIKSAEDIQKFYGILNGNNHVNECYLLRTDTTPRIGNGEWLNIVSKSDFFLCLSGTDLPMCHNAIEALAVGTIPIISYPDWFFPPLEHRKNAVEYYETYLTTASFIRRFEASPGKVNTIMLHPRLLCSEKENEQGTCFLKELREQLKEHSS